VWGAIQTTVTSAQCQLVFALIAKTPTDTIQTMILAIARTQKPTGQKPQKTATTSLIHPQVNITWALTSSQIASPTAQRAIPMCMISRASARSAS